MVMINVLCRICILPHCVDRECFVAYVGNFCRDREYSMWTTFLYIFVWYIMLYVAYTGNLSDDKVCGMLHMHVTFCEKNIVCCTHTHTY